MKKKIIQHCLGIARRHQSCGKHPRYQKHYSFIIQHNTIVAWGINRHCPALTRFGYTDYAGAHSEPEAYRKAIPFLVAQKPYYCLNIRLNKSNKLMLSKPCPICREYLTRVEVWSVHYSTENGFDKVKL